MSSYRVPKQCQIQVGHYQIKVAKFKSIDKLQVTKLHIRHHMKQTFHSYKKCQHIGQKKWQITSDKIQNRSFKSANILAKRRKNYQWQNTKYFIQRYQHISQNKWQNTNQSYLKYQQNKKFFYYNQIQVVNFLFPFPFAFDFPPLPPTLGPFPF